MKSFGGTPRGERLERIKASPRWAGERFRNVQPIMPGLRDPNASMPTIREFLCDGERRTPRRPLPSMNPLETWTRPPANGLRATWLGHSTVLIEIDGLRVLTDPVWGRRASPSLLAGPKRFQPVPVPLRAMPPVDLVIVSHDHYDHLDYPTIHEIAKGDVLFVTSLGVGAHLEYWGVRPGRIVELDWWESHELPSTGLTVTAAPSQHFSGRRRNASRRGGVSSTRALGNWSPIRLQRLRCRRPCRGRSTSNAHRHLYRCREPGRYRGYGPVLCPGRRSARRRPHVREPGCHQAMEG